MHPLIHITGEIFIPTYIFIISVSYCIGIVWVLYRTKQFQMDANEAINLCFCIMFGGFIGARFFHIVYESPEFYWNNPSHILKIWQGGFVFYGGAIGALLASLFWIKKRRLSFFKWADLFAPVFALGYGLGRLGCFFNGCCYGGFCELPWGIHFPHLPGPENALRHPTQLYATTWEFIVLALLLHLEFWSRPTRTKKADPISKNFAKLPTGSLFLLWATLHSVGRLLMEYFREDPRGPSILGISVSSSISLGILISTIWAYKHIKSVSK